MNFILCGRGFSCMLAKTEFEIRELTTRYGKQLSGKSKLHLAGSG